MDPIAWLESEDPLKIMLQQAIAVKTAELMREFNEDLANRIINKLSQLLGG